jgi:hypothetical protein
MAGSNLSLIGEACPELWVSQSDNMEGRRRGGVRHLADVRRGDDRKRHSNAKMRFQSFFMSTTIQ